MPHNAQQARGSSGIYYLGGFTKPEWKIHFRKLSKLYGTGYEFSFSFVGKNKSIKM